MPLFQRPELVSNSVPSAPRETALQTEIKEIFVRVFKSMMPERQGYILILLVNLPSNSSLVQRLHHFENIDAGIDEVSNIMKIWKTLQVQATTPATNVTFQAGIEHRTFCIEANCSRNWAKEDNHYIN